MDVYVSSVCGVPCRGWLVCMQEGYPIPHTLRRHGLYTARFWTAKSVGQHLQIILDGDNAACLLRMGVTCLTR